MSSAFVDCASYLWGLTGTIHWKLTLPAWTLILTHTTWLLSYAQNIGDSITQLLMYRCNNN